MSMTCHEEYRMASGPYFTVTIHNTGAAAGEELDSLAAGKDVRGLVLGEL